MAEAHKALPVEVTKQGERLQLLPEKAIWLPSHRALLLADLHLGKSSHFRKHGLAVPAAIATDGLVSLQLLVGQYPLEQLIFLGDLFHASYNREWEAFASWLLHTGVDATLVKGNHDILAAHHYTECGLTVVDELRIGNLMMMHHPLEAPSSGECYHLAGHLHPGVRLSGPGRQTLRLPCFYFSAWQGILPAFGAFTGLAIQSPAQGEEVFAIVEDRVIQLC